MENSWIRDPRYKPKSLDRVQNDYHCTMYFLARYACKSIILENDWGKMDEKIVLMSYDKINQ